MPEHPTSRPLVSENAKRAYNGGDSICPTNEVIGRNSMSGKINEKLSHMIGKDQLNKRKQENTVIPKNRMSGKKLLLREIV